MALSDFLFFGNGASSTTTHGGRYALYAQGIANGGSGTTNDIGGKGAAGSAILNSSLADPLSASIASTNCRGYMWGKAYNDSGYRCSVGATAYVKPASGGSKYPTNNIGGSDEIAYSARAFLRIQRESSPGNSTATGTNIGMFHKAWHNDGTTQFLGLDVSHSYASSDKRSWPNGGINSGYQVILSAQSTWTYDGTTTHANGGNSQGCNSVPRLLIVSPEVEADDLMDGNSTSGTSTACTGTYAYATWYHVRMDVFPNGGNDIIKVYTAPISGPGSAAVAGIGSETWTLVGTHTVYGASDSYVPWDDAERRYSGWFCTQGHNSDTSTTNPAYNAYIDRFQFLTKDIS